MARPEHAVPPRSWRGRLLVAICWILLVAAILLVRAVRLSRWRWTLGAVSTDGQPAAPGTRINVQRAALTFGAIEEAAGAIPTPVRCLPKAVAMQWMLRLFALPSRLVIAFHKTERDTEHAYHAWVEHAGRIVIGSCDTAQYQPVLTVVQGRGRSNPKPG